MSDTEGKKVQEPTEAVTDSVLAKKLAELDKIILEAKDRNKRMEAKEKELDDLKTSFKTAKTISPEEKQKVTESHKGKAQRMKEALAKQEKVSIFVPLEGKEKPGTQLPVTPNGYRVNVPKGVYVKVPKQIADIVMESLNQTEQATQVKERLDLQSEAQQDRLAA